MHRTLNVRYNVWPPWAMTYVTKNKTVLDGVLKDVFGALSQSMEYNFVLELQPDKRFGSLMPDGSFSGMVGALEKKEADLAGPLISSEERSLVAEFTNYLELSTLGMITGIEKDEGSTVEYTKILSWQVVLGLIISVIGLTLVSYVMQNVYLENMRFINWKFILSSLMMWCKYMIGKNMSVSKDHSSEKIWYRVSFRILLAAWLLGPVVNLLWTFQGSITSTFSVTKFKPVVGSLGELKKKTHIIPVTTKGSFVQICFSSNPDYNLVWQRMENHTIDFTPESIEEVFGKIEKRTHILIVDYVYALVIASDWVKKTGNCKVQVEELEICKSFISLGLRKGLSTKILRKINNRLNYIMQAKLTDRWMNRVYNNYTHCSKINVAEIKPLDFTSFRSIFIFWALGIILSIACLSIEISLSRRIPSYNKK